MGAEGGIVLVRFEDIKSYPDYKKYLPLIGHGCYSREINGLEFMTFYYEENVYSYDPFEVNDYCSKDERKEAEKFSEYLRTKQFADWEVWP